MKWALLVFYVNLWQIEAFTDTYDRCTAYGYASAHEANKLRWTCVKVARDPVFDSRP